MHTEGGAGKSPLPSFTLYRHVQPNIGMELPCTQMLTIKLKYAFVGLLKNRIPDCVDEVYILMICMHMDFKLILGFLYSIITWA